MVTNTSSSDYQKYPSVPTSQQPLTSSTNQTIDNKDSLVEQEGDKDYLEKTKKAFSSNEYLPVFYRYDTENKTSKIAKQIFSYLFFPIAIYNLLHSLLGKFIIPTSSSSKTGYDEKALTEERLKILDNREFNYKRLTLEVDGYKIDTLLMGKPDNLSNGRWILVSQGAEDYYETSLSSSSSNDVKTIMGKLNSNAIFFNYPKTSSGMPNRYVMAKAHITILNFLENKVNATEIIDYSQSLDAGIQSDALKDHELKKDIKYVFVKSRTFSNLSSESSHYYNRFIGFIIKILGWNLDCQASSRKLNAPEIILQKADVERSREITKTDNISNDGVIFPEASLAKALLDDPTYPKENKVFLGIEENYNDPLNETTTQKLTEEIEKGLKK